ncbi:unnamed protein product [Arabis nemorensis]|uniref:Auxin response factor n=1 Tax=Arabis nemorensis TaxID=586526 RepID=A0A565CHK1_9BRAS|nr:unnamed protein product [Arabis nemorensis]
MEKSLDSELWHACAGVMVKIPPVNSKVFYFPQGHAEHVSSSSSVATVDFRHFPRIPPLILCQVTSVTYLADPKTDEVYAKIGLIPDSLGTVFDQEEVFDGNVKQEPPVSFAKTLTQSDANNGGGFSVPRYCADTIFPRLDYTADPPVQNIVARDIHGETWKFRHIYRGTPRRHLLTTGWSAFVNHKRLMAGDSVVFFRAVSGDICIGVRRMKHSSGWSGLPDYSFCSFMREAEKEGNVVMISSNGNGNGSRVNDELVVQAAIKAANGKAFEVVYHPRNSTPEFCVMAGTVRRAMEVQWCRGMRFKMAFETEDSSRISWFMGSVSAVQPADTIRWPDSPWRLLEVAWDEPEMLQNVKRVSPWLVEPVSGIPALNFSPFSPPFKSPRLLQPPDYTQFPAPRFSSNLFEPRNFLPENRDNNINVPDCMQGARHTQFDLSLTRFNNPKFIPAAATDTNDNDVSCLLTMDLNHSVKNNERSKTSQFILFGRPILTEQEISLRLEKTSKYSSFNLETTNHCKVYIESEDVGRTIDLSVLGSYNAFCEKIGKMFGLVNSVMLHNVMYCDGTGEFRPVTYHEPFSEFARTARRLKIHMDSKTFK